MKLAITLRQSLGLTQHQLTGFIGGNRSVLTRAEKNERSLTPAATLNLLTLFQINASLPLLNDEEPVPAERIEKWKMHALACRHKITALQKKLADTNEGVARTRRLKNLLGQLIKTKRTELTERQVRWVEEQHYQASKKINANGSGYQRELQLSIAALEAEAAIYENAAVDF